MKKNITKILILIAMSSFVLGMLTSCANSIEQKYKSVTDAKSLTFEIADFDGKSTKYYFAFEDGEEDFDKDGKRDFEGSVMYIEKEKNAENEKIIDVEEKILTAVVEKKTVNTLNFDIFGLKRKNEIKVRYFTGTRNRHEYLESADLSKNEAIKKTKKESENLDLFQVKEIQKAEYDTRIGIYKELYEYVKSENKNLNFTKETYKYDKVKKRFVGENKDLINEKDGYCIHDKDEELLIFIRNINNTKLILPDFSKILDNKEKAKI